MSYLWASELIALPASQQAFGEGNEIGAITLALQAEGQQQIVRFACIPFPKWTRFVNYQWIGTFQAGFGDARDLPPWFMAQTNQTENTPCINFSFFKFHWLEADPKESFGPIWFCGCPLCGRANSNNPNQHGGMSQHPHGPITKRNW